MTYSIKQTMREKRLAVYRMLLGTTSRVSALCLLLVFGVLYVVQTSSVSTKGYDMNDLQDRITSLERENQRLAFKISEYRSMQSIQSRLHGMDLVAAGDVEYVTLAGRTVARR